RAKNGVGLQIEDDDSAVAAPVAYKSTPRRGSERHAMSVLLARNVCNSLAGLGIDHHRVRSPRNIQSMHLGVDGEIVPRALTADLKSFCDLPVRLRQSRHETG